MEGEEKRERTHTHTHTHTTIQNQTSATALCLKCGTVNTFDSETCVTCESPLVHPLPSPPPSPAPASRHTTSMHPISGCSYVMCGACGRLNVSDARFCDWCGRRVSLTH